MQIYTALNSECEPCAGCETGSNKALVSIDQAQGPHILLCNECLAKLAIEIIQYLKA